jgi:hypothetical protein
MIDDVFKEEAEARKKRLRVEPFRRDDSKGRSIGYWRCLECGLEFKQKRKLKDHFDKSHFCPNGCNVPPEIEKARLEFKKMEEEAKKRAANAKGMKYFLSE